MVSILIQDYQVWLFHTPLKRTSPLRERDPLPYPALEALQDLPSLLDPNFLALTVPLTALQRACRRSWGSSSATQPAPGTREPRTFRICAYCRSPRSIRDARHYTLPRKWPAWKLVYGRVTRAIDDCESPWTPAKLTLHTALPVYFGYSLRSV